MESLKKSRKGNLKTLNRLEKIITFLKEIKVRKLKQTDWNKIVEVFKLSDTWQALLNDELKYQRIIREGQDLSVARWTPIHEWDFTQKFLQKPTTVDEIDWKSISEAKILTSEQERNLFQIYHTSSNPKDRELAKKQIIHRNRKLVVSCCKKYNNRGLSFNDLKQEGELGLLKAIEKFDHKRGFKFSTFCVWWIRQTMTRAIADQARIVRIPVHMIERINKISAIVKLLTQKLGRTPTEQEILTKEGNLTLEQLRKIRRYATYTKIMEKKVKDKQDTEFGDFLEDAIISSPNERDNEEQIINKTDEMIIKFLTQKEQCIVRMRLGKPPLTMEGFLKLIERNKLYEVQDFMSQNNVTEKTKISALMPLLKQKENAWLKKEIVRFGNERNTLEETGKKLRITRERVRQIETKAYRKLRNHRHYVRGFKNEFE